jgi:hypothetical protein
VWLAIAAAAFLGAFLYVLRERSARALFLILLVAYFALTSIIAAFGTNPRYRLPVDPIILVLAATGTVHGATLIRRLIQERTVFKKRLSTS